MKTLTEFKELFQPKFLASLALVSLVATFCAFTIKGYFSYQDRQKFAVKPPAEQLSQMVLGVQETMEPTVAGWTENSEFISSFMYPPDFNIIPGEASKKELYLSNKGIQEPAQINTGTIWVTVQELSPGEYYSLQATRDRRRKFYTEKGWLESQQLVNNQHQIAVQTNKTKNYLLATIDYGDRVRVYSLLALDAETATAHAQQWLDIIVANEFAD